MYIDTGVVDLEALEGNRDGVGICVGGNWAALRLAGLCGRRGWIGIAAAFTIGKGSANVLVALSIGVNVVVDMKIIRR